ncbi:hypothetical protein V5O48_009010 [Marasmius crinis-equi]|uniref:Uncharacterized protein n=1 Tax=Marasmius crinis-equi TaxID=585013 RepID=A0ABR3FCE0_9AGAR
MLITVQETEDSLVCTIPLPDNSHSLQIANVVQLLVEWQRLMSLDIPDDIHSMFPTPLVLSNPIIANQVTRLGNLLKTRQRLRREIYDLLSPFLREMAIAPAP